MTIQHDKTQNEKRIGWVIWLPIAVSVLVAIGPSVDLWHRMNGEADLKESVANLTTKVDGIKADLSLYAKQGIVDALQGQVNSVSSRVYMLENKSGQRDVQMNSLNDNIKDIKSDLHDLRDKIYNDFGVKPPAILQPSNRKN